MKFTTYQVETLKKIVTYRLAYLRNLKNEKRPAEEKLLVELLGTLAAWRQPSDSKRK